MFSTEQIHTATTNTGRHMHLTMCLLYKNACRTRKALQNHTSFCVPIFNNPGLTKRDFYLIILIHMETQTNTVNYYGIFTVIGLLASILVLFFLVRKKKMFSDDLVYGAIWIAVGAFLGAHILFFFVNLPDFITNITANPPIDLGDFFTRLYRAASGLVFYGGLLGALLGLYIYTRVRHLPLRKYLNLFVVVFPLFHAIGRIGCVFSGCCYGIEYHGVCAIHYPDSVIIAGINDHITDFSRFPVQPLEALCEILIFVFLLLLYLKKGDTVSIAIPYLLLYAVVRFCDEFLRGDTYRGIWGPFSTSQWISLAIIVVTVIYIFLKRSRYSAGTA